MRGPFNLMTRQRKTCSVIDCDARHHGKGYCKKHYLRFHEHGDPETVLRPVVRRGPGPCIIEGCENPRVCHGWCPKHYQRWRIYGNPHWEPQRRVCTIEGCDRTHQAKGYCHYHYAKWRRYGDPNFTRPPRPEGCTVEGCENPNDRGGYCEKHHYAYKTYGDPLHPTKHHPKDSESLEERFWSRVNKDGPVPPELGTPCWEWTSYTAGGYGQIRKGSTSVGGYEKWVAHRLSWELVHGDITEGNHIHHRCENKKCVNPDHLESLTPSEHAALHGEIASTKDDFARNH